MTTGQSTLIRNKHHGVRGKSKIVSLLERITIVWSDVNFVGYGLNPNDDLVFLSLTLDPVQRGKIQGREYGSGRGIDGVRGS
jgi:hypothetical protein